MSHLWSFIPACEGYGWSGGPEFKTSVVGLRNGRNRRNAEWGDPIYRFMLPFKNISQSEYIGILNHFLVCKGMLHTFLYRNPLDDTAVAEVFGIGDGVTTEFQLKKVSNVDGVLFERSVTALQVPGANGSAVDATVSVTVAGAPASPLVDHDRGRVIFTVAPALGEVLRWSGQFAHWVRFAQDWLPFTIDNRSGAEYVNNGTIDLIDDVPPDQASSS